MPAGSKVHLHHPQHFFIGAILQSLFVRFDDSEFTMALITPANASLILYASFCLVKWIPCPRPFGAR